MGRGSHGGRRGGGNKTSADSTSEKKIVLTNENTEKWTGELGENAKAVLESELAGKLKTLVEETKPTELVSRILAMSTNKERLKASGTKYNKADEALNNGTGIVALSMMPEGTFFGFNGQKGNVFQFRKTNGTWSISDSSLKKERSNLTSVQAYKIILSETSSAIKGYVEKGMTSKQALDKMNSIFKPQAWY